MATIADQGTQTTSVSTTHTLYDATTTVGVFQGFVDLDNLAKGDVIEVWVDMSVRSGGNDRIVFHGVYANDMLDSSIVVTPPLSNQYGWRLRILQTAGSARSVPWRVDQIDG